MGVIKADEVERAIKKINLVSGTGVTVCVIISDGTACVWSQHVGYIRRLTFCIVRILRVFSFLLGRLFFGYMHLRQQKIEILLMAVHFQITTGGRDGGGTSSSVPHFIS